MGIIRQLSEQLANQIAAGEVVERPSSVVKELVENAIDAKSTRILVELVEAGIQSIKISDDGVGMEASDLAMAILPHATSKIYELNDLFQIQSLGFRGEALASIASVSKMTIESTINLPNQTASQGHFLKIHGSQIIEQGITSPRPGTVMTVESLFYNTPARLKHLSSLKTELRHILNFIQQIALAYPQIRFTLLNDGTQIFSSYGTGDLRQAIATVYQPAIARQLYEIQAADDDFKISGFISPPQLTRTSKYYIHWLINGRVIQSFVLNQLLLKAYGRQLMIGRYPVSVINIELDPQLVDVNVHPTKQTVRLSKEAELGALLTQAVTECLQAINPVPQVEAAEIVPNVSLKKAERPTFEPVTLDLTAAPLQNESDYTISLPNAEHEAPYFDEIEPIKALEPQIFENDAQYTEPVETIEPLEPLNEPLIDDAPPTNGVPFYDLRYVGQIHGTYLIAESENGFYLIDQHAAQEKLRYERLMKNNQTQFNQQHLLLPFVFQFSASDAALVEQLLSQFEALGIELTAFGPNTYQLESYPDWLDENQVESTIYDLVELLQSEQNLTVNQLLEKSIIMQSCRGAIKANHYLDAKQAEALIRDLATLDDPYHCPHGRPVFVEFTETTLEKLFKRIMDPHESGHRA